MANKGVYLTCLLWMTTAWAQMNPNEINIPSLAPGIALSETPASHLVLNLGGEWPDACVVLLDRSTRVPGAQIGQAGLVLCCDDRDCAGMILVHWFFFASGVHDTRNCVDGAPLSIPMQSATWINPREVALGVCFGTCGTLRRGNSGCALLQADNGRTYNLVDVEMLNSPVGPMGEFDFGDRVRVQGLLQISGPRTRFANLCEGQDADLHSAVLSRCAPAGGDGACCDGRFDPGDRVTLLVDNPRGLDGKAAVGLPTGSRGTIVCCGFNGADLSVFVSWDHYTLGTTAGALCGTPAGNYPVNSGWWARCDQIAPLAGGPASCSEDTLIIKQISYSQWRVLLSRDPRCPATSRPFASCITVSVGTSNAVVSTRVTPLAGITGTWNATATRLPNSGSDGTVYEVCVSSNGMDLTNIPAGVTTEVARLVLTVQ